MRELVPGEIVEATVTRLEAYGAWLDADGQVGVVTIPEISWTRIRHPGEVLAVGQRVQVKVLNANPGRDFSGSIRDVHPEQDPWYDPSLFAVGTQFTGRVVLVTEYGCFVELRSEVCGLLRRERWTRPMQVGDSCLVRVERVDVIDRKIEVSLVPENPDG